VSLTVARDDQAAKQAVEGIVTAYNDIVSFFDRQQAENQPLRSDPTLRSIVGALTNALRTVAPGTGDYTRGANVGLTLQQDGKLVLDAAAFSAALEADRAGVTTLFGTTGIGGALVTAAEGATRFGDGTIPSTIASIDRQSETLKTRIQREEDRLEDRRARLTEQFTRMEQAVARLQSQGSFISSLIAAANAQRRS
jgi:flagellar hook-associated protein 2